MEKQILCSTGTIVGRANGFDHRLIIKYKDEIEADGFELMMLKAFYGRLPEIAEELNRADVPIRTIHFEKDITALLGLGDEEDRREGLRLFADNVDMGRAVGAKKAVFHLWDGRFSAEQVESGILLLETLYEICEKRGVELLVEGVPCKTSPYALVCEIAEKYLSSRFTFDTRHSDFMGETDTFFESPLWQNRIGHIHVSDYSGETAEGMWGVTRPILHPGEGLIDFEKFFTAAARCACDTVTLESPVMFPDGTHDILKLNRTLSLLKKNL
ncbi:MAG: sugar phosphate isomerase/epimerase [Clostridia bacterium]|nr:sugar phosphate isomerase/epimerase [Clostridia bacterium]